MPAPVTIAFRVVGMAEVSRSFGGLEASMNRLERAGGSAAVRGASERVSTTKREVDAREKEFSKLEKVVEREEQKALAAKIKAGDEAVKALEKAEQRGVKEVERAEAQKQRIRDVSARAHARYLEQQTKTEERELLRQEHAAQSVRRRMASAGGSAVVNGTGRALGGIASMAGGALAIGGGFALADAVRGELKAERSASQLINLVTTGATPPPGANVGAITGEAGRVAIATGLDKQQVLDAQIAYAKNARGGDFAGVMANTALFAKLAKVGGVDMSVIAEGAGKLQSQNPELTKGNGMRDMLLGAMGMAKSGSVSFEQAIGQVGTLASTRGLLSGGDEAANQRKLIGLGQIAASGGESGDMGTYVKNVVYEIGAHRSKTSKETGLGGKGLESLGVQYDKQGRIDIEQAIPAIMKATGGDLTKIHAIVGNRGMPAFTEVSRTFNEAGGGEAGAAAVRKQMQDQSGSTMSAGDLDKRLADTLNTPAERFNIAMTKVTEMLQAKALPFLEKFSDPKNLDKLVEEFGAIVDAGGKLAEFFVRNPIQGIGLLISASVAKDLAGAAIGAGVKSVLEKGLEGAAGGLVGQLGRAGGAIGLFAAAAIAGKLAIDAAFAAQNAQAGREVGDDIAGHGMALANKRKGTLTPQDIAATTAQIQKLEAEKSRTDSERRNLSAGGTLAGLAVGNFEPLMAHATGTADDKKAGLDAKSKSLEDSIRELTATLKNGGGKPTGGSTGGADRITDMGNRSPAGGALM